jgi:hypothetical protein
MSELAMSFLLLPEAREGITNTSYAVAHFKLVLPVAAGYFPMVVVHFRARRA